jgi:hypothetical protein
MLPKEVAVELARALAVKISALLDVQKRSQVVANDSNKTWNSAEIADLIQVLFNQTSTEFQYFYEILLARRLLLCRYKSLDLEGRILRTIPALDKGPLMIRDIEQSLPLLKKFQRHLFTRMDQRYKFVVAVLLSFVIFNRSFIFINIFGWSV